MTLAFTKMHGAGNDFVVLDARQDDCTPPPERIRAMADRHTGIGFDQLLVITRAQSPSALVGYQIFNADGSTAGQCGNGARCIAAWLHRDGTLGAGETVRVDSPAGPVGMHVLAGDDVRVDMGEPCFDPASAGLPRAAQGASTGVLDVGEQQVEVKLVSMGNPHAVLEVDSLDDPRLQTLGPAITQHAAFAHGCNAGFAHVVDPHHITLRVHERGAGWTRACGSGACAAAAALIRAGRCQSPLEVALPGGRLQVEWPGPGHTLWLHGPAAFVFEGRWPLA